MKTFNCLEDQELRNGIKEYRLASNTAYTSRRADVGQRVANDPTGVCQGGVCWRMRYCLVEYVAG